MQHMVLIIEGRKENPCRRSNGNWHHWKIYQIEASGTVNRSLDETKQAGFYTKDDLLRLAERTEQYQRGEIAEPDWEESPGIEPVWYEWLKELRVI